MAALEQQLRTVDIERAELFARLERKERDLASSEERLRELTTKMPAEPSRVAVALHEANERVLVAERERDDARNEMERVRRVLQREAEQALEQLKDKSAQLADLQRAHDQLSEHCRRVAAEIAVAQSDAQHANSELSRIRAAAKTQSERFDAELESQRRELLSQGELVREQARRELLARDDAVNELRDLLEQQHASASRWREESARVARDAERTIRELHDELDVQRVRADQQAMRASEVQRQLTDAQAQLEGAHQQRGVLQRRADEQHAELQQLSAYVQECEARERENAHALQQCELELDRVTLERDRLRRDLSRRSDLLGLPRAVGNTAAAAGAGATSAAELTGVARASALPAPAALASVVSTPWAVGVSARVLAGGAEPDSRGAASTAGAAGTAGAALEDDEGSPFDDEAGASRAS